MHKRAKILETLIGAGVNPFVPCVVVSRRARVLTAASPGARSAAAIDLRHGRVCFDESSDSARSAIRTRALRMTLAGTCRLIVLDWHRPSQKRSQRLRLNPGCAILRRHGE
jgi:hypothetical protein